MKKKITFMVLAIIMILFISPINTFALPLIQIQDCENTLLGSTSDPNSVAWLLQQVFTFIKVLGPILVVVLSSSDFIKVIAKGDDDAMGKAQKKLFTRLVLAILLFLVPTLVEVILDLFGLTSTGTCGLG